MKQAKLLALIAALSLPLAVNATTINFNAGGINGVYIESGVTFSSYAGGSGVHSATTPNSTEGLLENSSPYQLIRADIAGGASMVSVDLGDYNGDDDTLVLRIYSASDVLLNSTSLYIDRYFSGMKTLSLSAGSIAYAVFGAESPALNGSSIYADNFVFAPVPEPETYAMMLAGLGMLGFVARRRKQSAG